jgi:ABC-2 type transport system ATP-binding protein
MDRGKLVLQDDLDSLRAPTGRVVLSTMDPERAHAVLDGRVESRAGNLLVVKHDDPAELNARLVAEKIRVTSFGPQQRTLEEVVLEATTTSSDRVDAP